MSNLNPTTAVSGGTPSKVGGSTTRRVASPAREAKVSCPPFVCPFALQPQGDKPEGGWDGDRRGTSTGLLFTHFLNELLYANYDNRWDDESLYAVVRVEYPNRATIQSFSRYRGCFNSATYGFGVGTRLVGENRLPRYQGVAEKVTPPAVVPATPAKVEAPKGGAEGKATTSKGESKTNPPKGGKK